MASSGLEAGARQRMLHTCGESRRQAARAWGCARYARADTESAMCTPPAEAGLGTPALVRALILRPALTWPGWSLRARCCFQDDRLGWHGAACDARVVAWATSSDEAMVTAWLRPPVVPLRPAVATAAQTSPSMAFFLHRCQIKRKKPAPQASGRRPERRKEGKGGERKGTGRLRQLLGDHDGTLRGLLHVQKVRTC